MKKHNFPENVDVVCDVKLTQKQAKEILKLSIDYDLNICRDVVSNKVNDEYPYYGFDANEGELTQFSNIDDDNFIIVNFNEFKNFIKGNGNIIKLELNNEYTAILTPNQIKVGCQTFTHETLEKLYKESQKIKIKNK